MQMSLFDQTDLIEVRSDAYPGERLMVCRNPQLAQERARKREDLLASDGEVARSHHGKATKREKQPSYRARTRSPLRVGKVIGKYKMAKHFVLDIKDQSFGYRRDAANPSPAKRPWTALYVVRTSLPASELDARRDGARLQALKRRGAGLSKPQDGGPESAARCSTIRRAGCAPMSCYARSPITSNGICADGLNPCCSTTRNHGRRRGGPRLGCRAPAKVSESAQRKARSKRTANGLPVHSFQTLLADLGDRRKEPSGPAPARRSSRSPWSPGLLRYRAEAFRLLGVRLKRTQ